MEQIRDLLDSGRSFDEYTGSIHSMAEILFRFLESLAEPIIPFSLYKQALESSASYNQVSVFVTRNQQESNPCFVCLTV